MIQAPSLTLVTVFMYLHDDAILHLLVTCFFLTPFLLVRYVCHGIVCPVPTSTPCLSSQRPCSHLCVQESATPTCHCLPHSTPEDGSNSVCMCKYLTRREQGNKASRLLTVYRSGECLSQISKIEQAACVALVEIELMQF